MISSITCIPRQGKSDYNAWTHRRLFEGLFLETTRCPPKIKHLLVKKNMRARGIQGDTQCARSGAIIRNQSIMCFFLMSPGDPSLDSLTYSIKSRRFSFTIAF